MIVPRKCLREKAYKLTKGYTTTSTNGIADYDQLPLCDDKDPKPDLPPDTNPGPDAGINNPSSSDKKPGAHYSSTTRKPGFTKGKSQPGSKPGTTEGVQDIFPNAGDNNMLIQNDSKNNNGIMVSLVITKLI